MKKNSLGNVRQERWSRDDGGKERRARDVEKAYGDWNQVVERVGERRARGEKVRRLGTSEKRSRSLKRRSREGKEGRVVVKGKWISGRLTNREGVKSYVKRYKETPASLRQRAEVRHYERYRKDLERWLSGSEEVKRPARRRCRDAERHRVALREARRCGVATVAVTSQPQRREETVKRNVTYRIPVAGGERVEERTRRGRREARLAEKTKESK